VAREKEGAAAPRGGRTDGPDLPKGRSDGGGSSRPGRAGTAQDGGDHGAGGGGAHAAAARMRQRRKATADGDRPAAESGG
jgi:hypothetical protein